MPVAGKESAVRPTSQRVAVALAVMLGLLLGLGLFTFVYAEGFSYFSTDPRACVNCHVMQPEYDSWIKSSHHTAARCVDCHLPHAFVPKYMAKADNGYRHSMAFTFGYREPIRITPRNERILHQNCLNCHQDMVHQLLPSLTTDRNAVNCVHCHAGVGHGPAF